MYRLTSRRQNITIMTVNALHEHLKSLSADDCQFTIAKVHGDRVSVRADYSRLGKTKHSVVVLPAYPTGWPDDETCNNLNVVLEPVSFENVHDCAERYVFAPLLGHEILAHYEKNHPDSTVPLARCC
jgi:hypothetical protein